ncbi:MAG: hypothetical protein GDA50_03395 [Alphaproteobacteria bacterium GM202ARS2]|nr:hypothetical protein [Alphaproteobacteria bacterium GM202ARS2]
MKVPPKAKRLTKTYDYRMQARSYAVQAVYQRLTLQEATEQTEVDNVELSASRDDAVWLQAFVEGYMADSDKDVVSFFRSLCGGVIAQRTDIEARLLPLLHVDWPLVKMVLVVRAFLLLGAWEWFYGDDAEQATLPPPQFIKAWLTVADGFCDKKEVSFLNAFFHKMTEGGANHGTG